MQKDVNSAQEFICQCRNWAQSQSKVVCGTCCGYPVEYRSGVSQGCEHHVQKHNRNSRKAPHLLKKNQFNLRRRLKQAWRGYVVWTKEAHEELLFWLSVNWELLWSPMGYDVLTAGLREVLLSARPNELAKKQRDDHCI